MRGGRGRVGVYLVEALLCLVCIAGSIGIFLNRGCPFDVPLLVLWGVVLLILAVLLVRGERRLRRAEEPADGLSADVIQDGV